MAYISFVKEWNKERNLPYKEALKQARDDYYESKFNGTYKNSELSKDDIKVINLKNTLFLENKFIPLNKGGKIKLCKCVSNTKPVKNDETDTKNRKSRKRKSKRKSRKRKSKTNMKQLKKFTENLYKESPSDIIKKEQNDIYRESPYDIIANISS